MHYEDVLRDRKQYERFADSVLRFVLSTTYFLTGELRLFLVNSDTSRCTRYITPGTRILWYYESIQGVEKNVKHRRFVVIYM